MLRGYNTFRQYVEYVEGNTVNPLVPDMKQDKNTDDEISNNPNIVTSKVKNPAAQKTFMSAIMARKSNPKTTLNAQIDGTKMATKLNNAN